MSSTPQNGSTGAPIQPSNKGSAAAPQLSAEAMEMGNMPGGDSPPQEDIMQLARVGNIQGMEKLFEKGDFDATYADDEGITPLHVCYTAWTRARVKRKEGMLTTADSGPQSTTSMPWSSS